MLKLIKLYRFNENKIVYLDKSMNQMASSVFQSTGPLISPTHRGGVDNFYFSGENMALKEYMDISGNYVSEIISALTPVVINGEVVVEAGNPFVLVSDSNDFVNTDGIL
jgi:hypothetical protein